MSSQPFHLKSLQSLRHFLKPQLVLPACEQTPGCVTTDITEKNIPEPDSLATLGNLFRKGDIAHEEGSMPNCEGRWFISTVDAGIALKSLPGIALSPGYGLVTYLYRLKKKNTYHGGSVTWAMENRLRTTSQLEAALDNTHDYTNLPCPEGALSNYMQAITGNLTAGSFLTASLIQRELQEFGRCGQLQRWHHHRLIETAPHQCHWQWCIDPPKDMTPKVHKLANKKTAVEFYTCRTVSPVGIFRHIDRYGTHGYVAKSSDQAIATRQ